MGVVSLGDATEQHGYDSCRNERKQVLTEQSERFSAAVETSVGDLHPQHRRSFRTKTKQSHRAENEEG